MKHHFISNFSKIISAIFLLLAALMATGCSSYDHSSQLAYTIDEQATAQAPWQVNEKTWSGECLGSQFTQNGDIAQCYTVFIGMTAEGQTIIQDFYASGMKMSSPYLVLSPEEPQYTPLEREKDSLLDGKFTFWYENGQKQAETHHQKGKQHGLLTMWYENGQKEEEIQFQNGKGNGPVTQWYENGQKKANAHYQDNKLHGLFTSWYENGQKKTEIHYQDGKPHGLFTRWDENGKKIEESYYQNGEKVNRKGD